MAGTLSNKVWRALEYIKAKIKEDVQFRKMWAEKCGFGFELPSVVPNVPKIAEKAEAQKGSVNN